MWLMNLGNGKLCLQAQVPLLMVKFHCALNPEQKAFSGVKTNPREDKGGGGRPRPHSCMQKGKGSQTDYSHLVLSLPTAASGRRLPTQDRAMCFNKFMDSNRVFIQKHASQMTPKQKFIQKPQGRVNQHPKSSILNFSYCICLALEGFML